MIDDFGRQRMTTDQLLNRWIVPLEKRYDFLNLASGKKIQVPFDQLIVFSTNLEPKDLVDDAFLRRIPYKIEVIDPDEAVVPATCSRSWPSKLGVEYDEAAADYLMEKHYRAVNRPLRCCQPRDLILQVRNFCRYTNKPAKLTPENSRLRRRELLRGDVGGRAVAEWLEVAESASSVTGSRLHRLSALSCYTRATAPCRNSAAAAGRASDGRQALRTSGSAGCRGCAGTCSRIPRSAPQIS